WVAQHHFSAAEGGLPSPLVFLSHAAAHTSRITLGTAIITLPMENAVRVAEDAAVLDALSDGRLEIGLGSGGNPKSFPAFGTSFDERREVFADKLATLRTLVSGGSLPTDHLLYPEAGTANPDRPGLDRRLWQATFSSGGAGAAGAAGDGLMPSRTHPRPQDHPGAAPHHVQLPRNATHPSQLPDTLAPTIRDSTGACGRRRSPPAGPAPPAPPGTGSCSHAPSRVRRTTRARPSTRCSCRSSTPTSPNFPTTSPRASSPPARRWSPMPPTCPGCARSPNRRCGTRPTASSA